jgi:polyisoprenoid-binding protein YceI
MTQPAPGASAAAQPPPGRYRLDPALTSIRADIPAMFGMVTVHGTFRLASGEVHIAEDPGQSSVRLTIDAGSFSSDLGVFDADVLSPALLDASAYPEIAFTGHGPRPDGVGWLLPGEVTAHGVTAPVEIWIALAGGGDGIARFRAVARLERTSFGITNRKGIVGTTVNLTVEAACVRA